MIEVPCAVAIADLLARECDFFSGRHQRPRAVRARRRSPEPARLAPRASARARAPADARAIRARGGEPHSGVGVRRSRGAPLALPVLLGLGYRSLSMPPSDLALTRELLDRLDVPTCETVARVALGCATGREVEQCVVEMLAASSARSGTSTGSSCRADARVRCATSGGTPRGARRPRTSSDRVATGSRGSPRGRQIAKSYLTGSWASKPRSRRVISAAVFIDASLRRVSPRFRAMRCTWVSTGITRRAGSIGQIPRSTPSRGRAIQRT